MWKLSNKTKVNFVKAYILFCFAWMILFIYVCFCYETGIHPEWKVACLVIFVLYVFFIIIMLYLMSVVNIVPLKVKPKIKKIGVNEFEELKKYILQGADKYGFQEVQIAGGDQLNMSLALKNDKDATYVLHLVWMDNFDEEKVMRATAICWENIEKWVGTKMMFQPIALAVCLCTANEQFI